MIGCKGLSALAILFFLMAGCAGNGQMAKLKSGVEMECLEAGKPRSKAKSCGPRRGRLDTTLQPGATYYGINLQGVNFRSADLKGADLGAARLDMRTSIAPFSITPLSPWHSSGEPACRDPTLPGQTFPEQTLKVQIFLVPTLRGAILRFGILNLPPSAGQPFGMLPPGGQLCLGQP